MLRVDDVALLENEARKTMQQLGYTAILSLPIQTHPGDIGKVARGATAKSNSSKLFAIE